MLPAYRSLPLSGPGINHFAQGALVPLTGKGVRDHVLGAGCSGSLKVEIERMYMRLNL